MNATELLQEALEEEDAERVAALQIGLNSSALDVARQSTDNPELLECIEESLPDARLRRLQRRTT